MIVRTPVLALSLLLGAVLAAETEWRRWRGPRGNGIAADEHLPVHWNRRTNIAWSARIRGEGASSPVIRAKSLFVTSAEENGHRRSLHCLDAATGKLRWSRTIEDDAPELSSSVTGHAASTPAAGQDIVVAFFGNAGVSAWNLDGGHLWTRDLGEFESELGLASSPVIRGNALFLVCDHDGDRFRSFDSFLTALDLRTGDVIWQTDRPDIYRSWSTPIVVNGARGDELVVCAQEEVRGYDPEAGKLLWRIRGLTGWVAPSPVFGRGLVFAASGKSGPVLAARPGGRGDVTETHTVWKKERQGAYVVSPLLFRRRLYVMRANGVLSSYRADTGERLFRKRLEGRFTASPIAGAGKLYFPAEDGSTWVLRAGDTPEVLARNRLHEYMIASPAAAGGRIFLRTEHHVFAIGKDEELGKDEKGGKDEELGEREGAPPEAGASEAGRPPAEARGDIAPDSYPTEERAIEYLARHVPRWPEENGCFSCHHAGDGARALFRSPRSSVQKTSLERTSSWLLHPERWKNAEAEEYADPALESLQFGAALLAGIESGDLKDRTPLAHAVRLAAGHQRPDGSWAGGSAGPVGSPTAYSAHLATYVGRSLLAAARDPSYAEALARTDRWLRNEALRNVHQAAVFLLAIAGAAETDPGADSDADSEADPEAETETETEAETEAETETEAWVEKEADADAGAAADADADAAATGAGARRARKARALSLLREGRAAGGGWGPYVNSAPEAFDTALVLLALASLEARSDTEKRRGAGAEDVEEWIRTGRGFLERTQRPDGSWPESTRPPGTESYAQRVSTTAWAAIALIATRPEADGKGSERRRPR